VALPQITLLAGAGFSKWSCQLPLVSELFDFSIHPDNATEQRRLERLIEIYDYWRSSHANDHAEAFIGFAKGPTSKFNLVNWYITRRLTEPFIVVGTRRYTWYINSHYPRKHEGIVQANRILDLLSDYGTLDVVTTNYDMVIEYALSTRGFNYGLAGEQIGFKPYPYPQPVHVTGLIKVIKLHGSISWSLQRKFPDLRCGLTGKCLIVPPIAGKTPPRQLQDQWSFAKKIISQCDVLVVFGFSFNEYDQTVRQFFTQHLSLKSKGHLEQYQLSASSASAERAVAALVRR